MNVFIDFLGYEPNCQYLIIEENNNTRYKWLFSHSNIFEIASKIQREKWNLVPNPRFKTFAGHLKLIKEIQEKIKV